MRRAIGALIYRRIRFFSQVLCAVSRQGQLCKVDQQLIEISPLVFVFTVESAPFMSSAPFYFESLSDAVFRLAAHRRISSRCPGIGRKPTF